MSLTMQEQVYLEKLNCLRSPWSILVLWRVFLFRLPSVITAYALDAHEFPAAAPQRHLFGTLGFPRFVAFQLSGSKGKYTVRGFAKMSCSVAKK